MSAAPQPQLLMDIAAQCREIIKRAEAALGPLPKAQYLDLVADNIPHASLSDLKAALVCAGVGYVGGTTLAQDKHNDRVADGREAINDMLEAQGKA